jgi:hypothetical protein
VQLARRLFDVRAGAAARLQLDERERDPPQAVGGSGTKSPEQLLTRIAQAALCVRAFSST